MIFDTRQFVLAALLLAGFTVLAEPAHALRCGSKLVKEGMHISHVIAICGEPVYEERRTILRREFVSFPRSRRIHDHDDHHRVRGVGPIIREISVTELTFNFGPRRLMRLLRFENGKLTDVVKLRHGYRTPKR